MPLDYESLASEYARGRWPHPGVVSDLLVTGAIDSGDRVLEVGCGSGDYIGAIRSAADCECWGIDPSRSMLSRARELAPGVNLAIGSAACLKFGDHSFDVVYSVDVIHHIKDRSAYLAECRRVLRSGGRLATVTDSEWIIRNRQPLATHFPETVDVDLARYPRISTLRRMMEREGFVEQSEHTVLHRYELSDIRPYEDRVFSCLHLIPERAYRSGIERMRRDLAEGPLPCVSRYLLLWGTREPLAAPSHHREHR